MNNPETSVTLGTQDTGQHVDSRYIRFTLYNSTCFLLTCIKICQRRAQNGFLILLVNKRYRQPKWQSRTDNPETSATLGTQDTGQRPTCCPVSCVPSVTDVSGLFICDCLFGFL
jgi:hypothetical protein